MGLHYVALAGFSLRLGSLPASASWVLGLQVCFHTQTGILLTLESYLSIYILHCPFLFFPSLVSPSLPFFLFHPLSYNPLSPTCLLPGLLSAFTFSLVPSSFLFHSLCFFTSFSFSLLCLPLSFLLFLLLLSSSFPFRFSPLPNPHPSFSPSLSLLPFHYSLPPSLVIMSSKATLYF